MVGSAWAQDDKAKLKQEILRKVEETIKAEEARILKNIESLLDKELGSTKTQDPAKPPSGRGFLGIRAIELTEDEREELKLKAEDGGVKIAEILAEGSADGKLETDDIILKIDGQVISNVDGLISKIQKTTAGAEVTIQVLREHKRQDVKVKLGAHPDEQPKPAPKEEKKEEKKEDKKEDPKQDLGKSDLKERIKKFLDTDTDLEKKLDEMIEGLTKSDQFQGMVDEMRSWIEKMGINPDQFFEMEDGKWKPTEQYKDIFKMVPGEMEKFLEQFRGKKEEPSKPAPAVRKPYLGILVEELSDEERRGAKLEDGVGLLVSGVREGSPAEKAGIKQGDILKSIGKDPARGEKSLQSFMGRARAGDSVELTLLRGGKESTVKVVLDERRD